MALDVSPRPVTSRPKLSDVAEYAGVSQGTVSNVLNHPHKVTEATITKVRDAIHALGFVRNANASSLAAGETKSIGLVVIDISNSLFVDIARGAQHAAAAHGVNLLLANSDNDYNQQETHLDLFDGAMVTGILLAPMEDSHRGITRVREHGRPVVVLNYASEPRDVCSVLIDNERAGYIAARHLIDLGRTRLAFVGGRDYLQPVHDRRLGVHRAIDEERGRVTLTEISTADLNATGGAGAGSEIAGLAESERPDGVIAVTDMLGMAIIQELGRAGISVPEEVAVMGCDHNTTAWGGAIPLTSVRMRGYDIGVEAIRLLIDEVTEPPDNHVHKTVMLEPALMIRESTVGRTALISPTPSELVG